MKKFKPKRILVILGIFIILIFFLALIFLNQIKSEIFSLISFYGYPAIFFVTIIVETLAQPIGPEIPLLAGRILGLKATFTISITILGTIIASIINYKVGSLFYEKVCKDERCTKYVGLYEKYGKYALLVASIGPVPYVPFCWFSGAFGLSVKEFLYFGIIPRIFRIIIVGLIFFMI